MEQANCQFASQIARESIVEPRLACKPTEALKPDEMGDSNN
ncbi:hypothetical protein JCM19240_2074 [Vibrio maritimus]|uniref:Uncharacterized protein n=1 Tax=Vibrio maritimus TaxID=990268 RepID=A0A090T2H9_9VIBR|nr:hypothetical protein JCM19240_2074 [Vibrio maritimus]